MTLLSTRIVDLLVVGVRALRVATSVLAMLGAVFVGLGTASGAVELSHAGTAYDISASAYDGATRSAGTHIEVAVSAMPEVALRGVLASRVAAAGPFSVLFAKSVAANSGIAATDGLAGRVLNVNGTTVTYSERVIARSAAESGPMHNFPMMYDETIIGQGTRTVASNGYTQYSLPGTINGTAGAYEIGGWYNAAGDAFDITHRFFRPGG